MIAAALKGYQNALRFHRMLIEAGGRVLIGTLIQTAREIGYEQMRLDTLPSMTRAMEIYRSLGFKEIAPYRVNPVPGASFLELELNPGGANE